MLIGYTNNLYTIIQITYMYICYCTIINFMIQFSILTLPVLIDREECGNALQYSCLGNLWTEEPRGLLSVGMHRAGHNWSGLACMHALEKEMATHSSILAWRIPGTE